MVRPQNVAWHAGNWYINSHSIGIEHEGYAAVGGYWYTENMYKSSAALVKYLADKYQIPLDRQHIIGHDNVPGLTPAAQKGMHWDPGTYWNWNHYFELMGVDLSKSDGSTDSHIITITPNDKTNLTADSGQKVTDDGVNLPLAGSNFVYLYEQPSFSADLIADKDFSSGQSGPLKRMTGAIKPFTANNLVRSISRGIGQKLIMAVKVLGSTIRAVLIQLMPLGSS